MVNGRNIFTYFANILMLTLSLILFLTIVSQKICFQILTLICLGIGFITSSFYYSLIREVKLSNEAAELDKAFKQK